MEKIEADIKFFSKGSFYSVSNENEKHIKILPYLSVVQAVEGSYSIALGNGERRETNEGNFFIAPSGIEQTIVHHVNAQSGKMSARWIFLDVEFDSAYKADALYSFPLIVKEEGDKARLNAMFDRIFATDDFWENCGDCYKLMGALLRMATPIEKGPHKGIQSAITYMKSNYFKQISIPYLASISNMSESNFYTAFKKALGDSPISYLNRYRLSHAAVRLIESDERINEIGSSVGISDALYFSKLFRKAYGISPKEYRRIYKKIQ